MAHIQKIKTKKGTAHRVKYSKFGKPFFKYFAAGIPLTYVKNWANQIEAGKLPHVQQNKCNVEEIFDSYISMRENEIDLTWHKSAINNFKKHIDPETPAAEITWKEIHDYRDARLAIKSKNNDDYAAEQKARRGVNKELSNLRTIFNWAYSKDLVPSRIFDKVEFLKAAEPVPSTLSRDSEKRFVRRLEKAYRLAYWILKYTGLRRGECVRLKWEDIDLKAGAIRLVKTKPRDEAFVPLHPKLARIFRWVAGKKSGRIFKFHRDTLTCAFRRALNKAGLDSIKSPVHVFRHTVGMRIMQAGVTDKNERLAQEILRHKTKTMTKHYTRIVMDQLKNEIKEIDL